MSVGRIFVALVFLFVLVAHGADKLAASKTTDFVISGLECGSCAYMVQYQLSQTQGVVEVEVLQGLADFARVTYNPAQISEHQIAQSVREAVGLHGTPYIATLKIRIAGYAKQSAKVKALFEPWKSWVGFEKPDTHPDELILSFQELKPDAKGATPRGWTLIQLADGLQRLGLKLEILTPDMP